MPMMISQVYMMPVPIEHLDTLEYSDEDKKWLTEEPIYFVPLEFLQRETKDRTAWLRVSPKGEDGRQVMTLIYKVDGNGKA